MQDRPALEPSPLAHPLLFARAQPCQVLARACGGERSLPATLPTLRTWMTCLVALTNGGSRMDTSTLTSPGRQYW